MHYIALMLSGLGIFREASCGKHSVRGLSPLYPLHFTFSQKVGETIGQTSAKMNATNIILCTIIAQPRPVSRSHRMNLRRSAGVVNRRHGSAP